MISSLQVTSAPSIPLYRIRVHCASFRKLYNRMGDGDCAVIEHARLENITDHR